MQRRVVLVQSFREMDAARADCCWCGCDRSARSVAGMLKHANGDGDSDAIAGGGLGIDGDAASDALANGAAVI